MSTLWQLLRIAFFGSLVGVLALSLSPLLSTIRVSRTGLAAVRTTAEVAPPYEDVSPIWGLVLPSATMYLEDTVRYGLNGSEADENWSKLVPVPGGIVHVGPEREPYLLSIFHQLLCLDTIRRSYVARDITQLDTPGSEVVSCLNYLRQTVLCRRDLQLEPVVDPFGPSGRTVDPWGPIVCQDWRVVYEALTGNTCK